MPRRTVESRCPTRSADAERIATAACAEIRSDQIEEDEYRIVLFEDREELWDVTSRKRGMPLSFQRIDRRVGAGNLSRKQPLGRAIGSQAEFIIDATAGLGHDACLLACMGWRVTAIERDPFIAAMLTLARDDAVRCDELWAVLRNGLTIRTGSAETILTGLESQPDVIYLDPMFTERRKGSALPKKPAQVLQALAAPGDDAALLAAARQVADRVVVKRPAGGPSISEPPDLEFKGRLVRYDVYLRNNSH